MVKRPATTANWVENPISQMDRWPTGSPMSLDIAILGGLVGTVAAVLFLQILEVARPSHNEIRVITLIGSAFTQNSFRQQLVGRAVLFAVGAFYGIFNSAVAYAFELERLAWLIGVVVAVLLWVLTGITLTYFRLLHPRIRKGEMKAPGPFGLNYSRRSAAMLLVAHVIFGVVCGAVYGTIA